MFNVKRRSRRRDWPSAMIPLLAALVAAAGVSCSSGVAKEEFEAVQEDLETERALSQSLESQLAQEGADVALVEKTLDRAEARLAELVSELAREKARTAGHRERVDEAEAEADLLAAFLAWNRKDPEGFSASFTDKGISGTSLSLPALLGEPPIALRRVMDATVSSDTATIHAMFALGTQRNSVRYSMAKQGGVWKIDGEERLSPKIHGNSMVVDVRLDGCESMFDSETITGRNVALRVENVGEEHHHLILKKVPEELDLGRLLQGNEPPSQGVDDVAFVGAPRAGELINVAFTEALQPGRYVLLCYPLDPKDDEGVQLLAEGIVAAFTVR